MAQFNKINVPSRKEMFVRELEGMILSGELKVGEKLPTERELAASMQVSRGVVNAGLVELARAGFLIMEPRVGSFVADYRRNGNFETLSAIVNNPGIALRNEEIASILELRGSLSNTVVRKLIENVTDEQIILFRDLCERIRIAEDSESASQAAFNFHHELAIECGNFMMPLIYNSFHDAVIPLWKRFCNLYGIEQLYQNTRTLLDFIEARDADGAERCTNDTMEEAIHGNHPVFN